MKSKQVRAILLKSEDNENRIYPCILQQFNGKIGYYDCNIRTPTIAMSLILISLDSEEKIEEGDTVMDFRPLQYGLIYKVLKIKIEKDAIVTDCGKFLKLNQISKIVVTQPQLSSELINKLINQYNTNGKFEDFKIEMHKPTEYTEDGLDFKGDLQPKLINKFVEVVEPKQPITYTEEEVYKLCYGAMKDRIYTPQVIFRDWFNKNKKK